MGLTSSRMNGAIFWWEKDKGVDGKKGNTLKKNFVWEKYDESRGENQYREVTRKYYVGNTYSKSEMKR